MVKIIKKVPDWVNDYTIVDADKLEKYVEIQQLSERALVLLQTKELGDGWINQHDPEAVYKYICNMTHWRPHLIQNPLLRAKEEHQLAYVKAVAQKFPKTFGKYFNECSNNSRASYDYNTPELNHWEKAILSGYLVQENRFKTTLNFEQELFNVIRYLERSQFNRTWYLGSHTPSRFQLIRNFDEDETVMLTINYGTKQQKVTPIILPDRLVTPLLGGDGTYDDLVSDIGSFNTLVRTYCSVIEQAALFNDGLADLSGLGAKHDGVIVEDPYFAMDPNSPEKRNLTVRIDAWSVMRIELRNGSLLLAA